MEISSKTLEKLKCSNCFAYLSCGPIFINANKQSICGRCTEIKDESAVREINYETLARLFHFPCRYDKQGCPIKMKFSKQEPKHEISCRYRSIECPLIEAGCRWKGPKCHLLKHCNEKHSGNVLNEPCTWEVDVRQNLQSYFIILAHNVLFYLYLKVDMELKQVQKMFKYLGNEKRNRNYEHIVNVENVTYTRCERSGDSTLEGILDLNLLQKLKTITFSIKIDKIIEDNDSDDEEKQNVVIQKCAKFDCDGDVARLLYRRIEGWLCETCSPKPIECENKSKGCNFCDISMKCMKHKDLFCKFNSKCSICTSTISNTTLDCHYTEAHNDITFNANTDRKITFGLAWQKFIITSDIGPMILKLNNSQNNFKLHLRTSLSSDVLYKYDCKVHLTDPKTKHYYSKLMELVYNFNDYEAVIAEKNFTLDTKEFMIKIEVIKK